MPNIDIGAMSDDDLEAAIAKAQGSESINADVLHTIPSSLEKVAVGTATSPFTAMELAGKAKNALSEKLAPPAAQAAQPGASVNIPGVEGSLTKAPPAKPVQSAYDWSQEQLKPYTGTLYEPQGTTAKAVDAGIQNVLPALAGPGGMARKLMTGVAGGVGGELAKEGAENHGFSNLSPWAQAAGTAAGTMVPALLRRGVTPFPSNDAQLAMAKTLKGGGMDVSAGLKTGSPTLQRWEQSWTGKPPGIDPKQFTTSALKGAGVDPKTAASGADVGPIINSQMNFSPPGALGQKMDDLAKHTESNFYKVDPHGNLILDAAGNQIPEPELEAAKTKILRDYAASGGKLSTSKGKNAPGLTPIEEAMTKIFGDPNKGSLPSGLTGQNYHQVRRDLSDQAGDLFAGGDAKSGRAISQLGKALDDNMARSSVRGSEWPAVFKEYEQGKILQKTNTSGSVPGTFDPKSVYSAASGHPNSDLYKVSKAASEIGNTAPAGKGIGDHIAPLAGAGLGGYLASKGMTSLGTDPQVLGLLAGSSVGGLLGRGIGGPVGMSGPGQAYLGNQALRGGTQGGMAGSAANSMMLNPKLDSMTAARLLGLEAAQKNMDRPPQP